MRAADRFVASMVMILLVIAFLPSGAHSDGGIEKPYEYLGVLCGDITEETWSWDEFFITCTVTVHEGVRLLLDGNGYVSPWARIIVYGTLTLYAHLTWNTTSPPANPEDWRWGGIRVRNTGHIDASWFSIKHVSEWGIMLGGSSNNRISRGYIEDVSLLGMSSGYAIGIHGSHNNIVEGVTFSDAGGAVDLNDASGNVIRNSVFIGIDIRLGFYNDPTEGNYIICNDFKDYGELYIAALWGSANNHIHHNNFLGSSFAYKDGSGFEIWDDGYPNGGNYWIDYQGNDSFRGPNQDFPGSDGIGDEVYKVFDHYDPNYDHYPFMNPVPKSNCPSPPPQMPLGPFPPYNVTASLEGPSLSNVNISWELSWDESSPGFQNYALYYAENYNKDGLGYELFAELPPGSNYFVHSGAGHGNPNNYFYYVQANDSSGHPGKSYYQVAKFTQNLNKGWHLASIPLLMDDMRLENIFRTVDIERALVYSSSTKEWREYNIQKDYQGFESLSVSQGIWIKTSQYGVMTITGRVPSTTAIDLSPGWNLVGYPSFIERNVATSMSGIQYERIESFEFASEPYYLEPLQSDNIMFPGRGYWVKVTVSCVWEVEN